MIQITTSFLQNIFGAEPVRGNKVLEQKFDQIFYLFRGSYPSMKSGNHSLTMALSAMGFFLNAEAYFNKIDPKKGKDFIVAKKDEFLKYYNFDAVLADIRKGNEMLFLYNNSSPWINKLSAHGVIGKFYSIEFFSLHDRPLPGYADDANAVILTIRLEIGKKGLIDLPVVDIAYFGRWTNKLELIM